MKVRSGSFIAENESRNTIQEKQSLVVRKIGRVPVTKMDINISQQTINNYLAMIVNQQGVSIYTSIATKLQQDVLLRTHSSHQWYDCILLLLLTAKFLLNFNETNK